MLDQFKSFILNLVDKSAAFREIYCKNGQKANQAFLSEVERRKKLDIWDYKEIAQDLAKYPLFYILDTNLYGLLFNLYNYANLNIKSVNTSHKHFTYIEHGIIVGDYVDRNKLNKARIGLTYSDFRKDQILNSGYLSSETVHCVGPYIHYVDMLWNEPALAQVKKNLGKVLLVFPHHSLPNVGVNYNIDDFIQFIQSKSVDYNNVVVCLYWADILKGSDKPYVEAGFKIVCAGHRNDLYFLSRLKTIISLADSVISNAVGTDLGYCCYLNRPVYIYDQQIEQYHKIKNSAIANIYNGESEVKKSYEQRKSYLKKYFNEWRSDVSKEQYEVLNYFFGFDKIKNKEEMSSILNNE